MRTHSVKLVAVSLALLVVGFVSSGPQLNARVDVPARLSDAEFWQMTEELSEENGYFRSDNFLSNETGYQYVISDVLSRVKPGGVYLGVAPEINFTYIAAIKPKMAFIIDIRRGNLHEHLLYKALFEMSNDRAEFLSKLFSRKRPSGLNARSTVDELFAAYRQVEPTEEQYKENLKAVLDWLTKKHEFKLRADDPDGIDYVYREAFFTGGPDLNYSFGSGGGMGRNTPTYEMLMRTTDESGVNRSFLATDENFQWVKAFQSKNLLVPLVGNFGGPKTIRAVGRYVREKGATVTTFYLSNVEQYLVSDGIWNAFCANVASLPLDDTGTFIFSGRGGPGNAAGFGGFRGGGGLSISRTRPMLSEAKACAER